MARRLSRALRYTRRVRARIGLLLGPALFALILLIPPPEGLSLIAWRAAAVAVLMAVWWITEPIPIAATALLPLVFFPLLGILTMPRTAAPYANPVIFLFLGGFLIAAGVEQSGLHRRIALRIVRAVGSSPPQILFGFMLATAALSAGVSNTATVALMLPMALSVIAASRGGSEDERAGFGTALMLGIAYSASIGGLATLIGTPPNALLAGWASETLGRTIGFARWMILGVPLAAIALPLCWLLLVRLHPMPDGEGSDTRCELAEQASSLGRMSVAEKMVGSVIGLTALAWVTRPLLGEAVPGLSDAGIAILAAVLLFIIPVKNEKGRFLLGPRDLDRVPWPVLILFGGGLALAEAIDSTGLAAWIGGGIGGLSGLPPWIAMLTVATVIIFLTELTSNTATAATFIPIIGAAAVGIGVDPLMLCIPAALGASCAFMLPVATPPNAIVFGSGQLPLGAMIRAGFRLNLLMIAIAVAATMLLGRFV
jgi:solute carrier family 13 (sodium-dependent dicarboxylate transporter), member 2/3/5